ncbi:MAG: M56 family metallopeptidase [Acidobacteria bacterium]|nr:M56 family metallopeptidase [Acidobacteriota bacterium]
MIGQLTNHLWQTTVFAVAAGILTIAFRRNRAQVRYWLWFSASLKFFVPFSLLMNLGNSLPSTEAAKQVAAPTVAIAVVRIAQPFAGTASFIPTSPGIPDWMPFAMLAVWAAGFGTIALMRFRGWRRIQAAVRSSTPIDIPAGMRVRSAPGLLEPGVVGLFRPILLLPAGIVERLKPLQFEAVLAHELCHVRRRDNLFSASHMIVEAMFWFHPLVWWIGARLVEERERACDEAVLSLGSEPRDYAEGIISVCKSYLESPLSCVAGVTGSNLKKRLQAILAGNAPCRLNFSKKAALAVAGMAALAVPIVAGILSAATPKFEAAAIKTCTAFRGSNIQSWSPGTLRSECTTVERLIQQAYGLFADGHMNPLSSLTVTGGPAWVKSELYEIEAEAEGKQTRPTMNGPMLQALLEDRFKLRIHREARELPVYALTVDKAGSRLQPFQGSCTPRNFDHPTPGPAAVECGSSRFTSSGLDINGATMAELCMFFLVTLDRPVIDETGLAERFNLHLELSTGELDRGPRVLPALSDPSAPAADPALASAIKTAVKKLGLNLEPAERPGDFLVIDDIHRPTEH